MAAKKNSNAEGKVKIYITPDGGDPVYTGCINGVVYRFNKGQWVEVPEFLAKHIEITNQILSEGEQFSKAAENVEI